MNGWLFLVLIGFLQIAIGAVGYLQSIVVEKHSVQVRYEVRDMSGRLIETGWLPSFFEKYKIVRRAKTGEWPRQEKGE